MISIILLILVVLLILLVQGISEDVPGGDFSGFYKPNLDYTVEFYGGSWLAPKQRFILSKERMLSIQSLEGATFFMVEKGYHHYYYLTIIITIIIVIVITIIVIIIMITIIITIITITIIIIIMITIIIIIITIIIITRNKPNVTRLFRF